MQTASQALSTWNPGSLTEAKPAAPQVVHDVFEALRGQLGSKLVALYGAVPVATVQAEWALGLAGFHPSEIARGLAACRNREFAPVLGEFTRLCRPTLDPEIAWLEAQAGMTERAAGRNGTWSHPAVYRAGRDFQHELRTGSFAQHRKAWEWRLNREFALGWEGASPADQLRHLPAPAP